MAKRVLIVDDEENIRQMTRLALEAAGYEVGEAASGMEAFAIIGGDDSWDAVLLDQKIPGMVGTEVLRRIKVMLPSVQVIMMTAYASVELAIESMKLGATDFVRKPMTPEILRNALAAAFAEMPKPQHSTTATGERKASPLRTVTLNGFTILRAADVVRLLPHKTNERCFEVRTPQGRVQDVVVEIDSEAITAVEKVTRNLPIGKAFWTEQAERFLTDFLWNDGHVPANGRLTLKGVEREALEQAARKEVGNDQTHSDN
jgi:DNA-binding response OmpR family regulator